MLEVWNTDDAFAAVEAHLRDAGFFDRRDDDLFADVFFGYRLSDRLRRLSAPAPPEVCALPAAACEIRHPRHGDRRPGSFAIGDWDATWREDDYAGAIEAVREAISRGDVYQVNLVQHLSAPFRGDPAGLVERLAPLRPLHGAPLQGDGWTIVSASPELFLARRGARIWTMPIKGTRPAGSADDLRGSEKDAAEHVMIVDLERNDLSRVCEPGTVRWPKLMAEHELAGVTHLVSTIEGRLREDISLTEILDSTFPGGSITGAPKISAVDHIAALEPVGRGASMGALGRIYPNGDFDLALTIRTFAVSHGRIHLWVGGGIVWDSDPHEEIEESWVKARPLLAAIGTRAREPVRA
ncbi:MAG: anthranilate synthase component I family protein [Actinomycetota bacterium]|nr:anthranilate synthase component I family protein [Actinomycetota bacterium]